MPDDQLRPAPARVAADGIVREILDGLRSDPKTLPAKLFYDEAGCRLFYRITELPEYYPTRTEMALLKAVAPIVAGQMRAGAPAALIEYGASQETKAALLLNQVRPDRSPVFGFYVPIDVAAAELAGMRRRLQRERPGLAVLPIVADFLRPLDLPRDIEGIERLGFFPGSTIGNCDGAQARDFLAAARGQLGPGARMLVGVDLRKSPAILLPAYDDPAGVTAQFNLNMLAHVNRLADADFDLAAFEHRAWWNDGESRIEMHLLSRCDQIVHVAGEPVRFRRGETIHTENSYKYTPEAFHSLAARAGWRPVQTWLDRDRLFSLHLLAD